MCKPILGQDTGAWCYYNNVPANGGVYGKLYNGFAVAGIYDSASLANPALRKKLAPAGWHIPSDAEWATLINFLGGQSVAGGKMKAKGFIQAGNGLWQGQNTNATNESGFSGLPGGQRFYEGSFDFNGWGGQWWSSSESTTSISWCRILYHYNGLAGRYSDGWINGHSVRCIKD